MQHQDEIFGLDFGTTNSCLAIMENGKPRILEIDGQPTVPSLVSYDRKTGEVIVGQRARNRMALWPEDSIRSVKRHMGEDEPLEIAGRALLPEQLAAEIMRYMAQQATTVLGRPVRRVVITVPAFFEDAQRRATLRAGELAGLEVVRILNEPTAAAMFYDRMQRPQRKALAGDASRPPSETILVYDLGGGTFDASVVRISGEINEVLASRGDNHLGGDDFDQLLVEHLIAEWTEQDGTQKTSDAMGLSAQAQARLVEAAERAKIDLSSRPFTRLTEEALVQDRHLDLEISRATFESLVASHLEATRRCMEQVLEDARLTPDQIDRVVLVGGSTAIPRLLDLLAEIFTCPIERAVDPALCVAAGAAVQGAILAGQIFDHILVDIAPHSLGFKVYGQEDDPFLKPWEGAQTCAIMIHRNTQIPCTFSEVFRTLFDDQETVNVEVYQGESRRCAENTFLDEFDFPLAPAPAGSELIVEFHYDLNGMVRVSVEQKGFDNRLQATFDSRRQAAEPAVAAAPPNASLGGAEVDNYILRKARAIAETAPDDLRAPLELAADAYATALQGPDEGAIDRTEDALLEAIEDLEERSAPLAIDSDGV